MLPGVRLGVALLGVIVVAVWIGPAEARVTVDSTPPTLSIPNISVSADSDCGSTFCGTVDIASYETVSDPDNTPAEISVHCNTNNGSTFFWGTGIVTCQAFDPAGNFSPQLMFSVTVTVPVPTFQNVPAPTFAATGPAGAVATFAPPTATDVGGQAVPVNCDHSSGITYPLGTTTVTCTANLTRKDSVGNTINVNSANVQFPITITSAASGGSGGGGSTGGGGTGGGSTGGGSTGGGSAGGGSAGGGTPPATQDTTAPVLAPISDLRVNAAAANGAAVSYTVAATDPDTPSAQLTIACAPAAGSIFSLGPRSTTKTTTVTCRAADPAGNQSAPMSFAVTVVGFHDQLLSLEHDVSTSSALSKRQKASLGALLVRADRDFAAESSAAAREQLSTFMTTVEKLPVSLGSAPTAWLAKASRARHLIL